MPPFMGGVSPPSSFFLFIMKAKAITFDQLIAYGTTQIGKTYNGASTEVVNGIPFFFRYENRTILQTGSPTQFRIAYENINITFNQGELLVTSDFNTTLTVLDPT